MLRWTVLFLLIVVLCSMATPAARAGWVLKSSEDFASPATPKLGGVVKMVEGSRPVTFRMAWFDTRDYDLRIVDVAGPDRMDLQRAMQSAGCVAGVNGGFFHKDFRPAGLVVSGGKVIHPQEKAKLLSGVLAVTRDHVQVLRPSEFKMGPAIREAIQAGPFLVENGKAISSLNSAKPARRTIVVTDGKRNVGLVCFSEWVTLAEAAEILTASGVITEFPVVRALNLDGGSSTGFWLAGSPPYYIREYATVRNFVGVMPRK